MRRQECWPLNQKAETGIFQIEQKNVKSIQGYMTRMWELGNLRHVHVENLKYCEGTSEMQNIRDLPVCVSQGLLKVAVESARSQDKHNQQERKELKLELERERDARQTLQRQLSSELHTRGETGVTGQRSNK